MKFSSIFKSKKLKYGSISVAFTAIFIAVIVLLNIVLSIINVRSNQSLDIDLTENSLYTVSDASVSLLQANTTPVTFYFLQERDAVKEDSNSEGFFLNLVDSYAEKFDWIDVQYVDIQKNPKFKNSYTKSSTDTLDKTSVIIDCKQTGEYKILTAEDYFLLEKTTTNYITYQYVAKGFQGELAVTSALLNVINPDNLLACYTTNHKEATSKIFNSFLEDVGYEVRAIDLSAEDIDDNTNLLIVNNPQYDFTGTDLTSDTVNFSELDKLVQYMDNSGHNMMVFMSPQSPKLKEFEEFLATYGVDIQRSVISDKNNSYAGTDGLYIYGEYYTDENSVSAPIVEKMTENKNKTMLVQSAPINILFESKNNIFVAPILTTSKTASLADDETTSNQYNIMTISSNLKNTGTSNLIVCSSVYFAELFNQTLFANRDLMYSIAEVFGAKNIVADIPIKNFDDTSLDLSGNSSTAWGMVITIIPAAIVLSVGIAVWIKRRHL